MKKNNHSLLQKGEVINNTYTVQFFIGEGAFGEVYRVKHKYLGLQVLKVLKKKYEEENELETIINEANLLSKLTHPNIVRLFEANEFEKNGQTFYFFSMDFVSGETIAQRLNRLDQLDVFEAISIQNDLLTGLNFLHQHSPTIIHRDINMDNVLLSYENTGIKAMLSDFGLANIIEKGNIISGSAGRILYFAPECFWNVYLPASDVFSAGLILYQMVTGKHPWDYEFENEAGLNTENFSTRILAARKHHPIAPQKINPSCSKELQSIILKAIELNLENRYQNAYEFLKALKDQNIKNEKNSSGKSPTQKTEIKNQGNGFDGIAGMNELKDTLLNDVILPLKDKSIYEKYRVSIPNGMLLYGPPGCGKTFISRKFSEEIGYNFIEIKPSDLASIYVHGTQEKIGNVFKEAKENAPTIIFIDELDAILPNREGNLSHSYASEVNEFLAQMTECNKDGIFIIAATNRPEKIDPAILRTGRIDKVIYIPPPDFKARLEMFIFHLKERPCADSIDFQQLANKTENYVSSDLSFIVNEASREALKKRILINQEIISEIIEKYPPSISLSQIKKYEAFKNNRNFI
jgi:transitional endoplasmic reticulum ATPase